MVEIGALAGSVLAHIAKRLDSRDTAILTKVGNEVIGALVNHQTYLVHAYLLENSGSRRAVRRYRNRMRGIEHAPVVNIDKYLPEYEAAELMKVNDALEVFDVSNRSRGFYLPKDEIMLGVYCAEVAYNHISVSEVQREFLSDDAGASFSGILPKIEAAVS